MTATLVFVALLCILLLALPVVMRRRANRDWDEFLESIDGSDTLPQSLHAPGATFYGTFRAARRLHDRLSGMPVLAYIVIDKMDPDPEDLLVAKEVKSLASQARNELYLAMISLAIAHYLPMIRLPFGRRAQDRLEHSLNLYSEILCCMRFLCEFNRLARAL